MVIWVYVVPRSGLKKFNWILLQVQWMLHALDYVWLALYCSWLYYAATATYISVFITFCYHFYVSLLCSALQYKNIFPPKKPVLEQYSRSVSWYAYVQSELSIIIDCLIIRVFCDYICVILLCMSSKIFKLKALIFSVQSISKCPDCL